MSFNSWDREVAPYLRLIESSGKRLVADAHDLGRAIPMLRTRPEFLTRAEDTLEQAEAKIAATLAEVRAARTAYAALPVERPTLIAAE